MTHSYIINMEALLRRFTGNHQVIREILDRFHDSIPHLVETLKGHVADAELDDAFVTAKKIHHIARCSSALTVQECAFQMEHAVIREDIASVQEIVPLLEQMCDEVIEALKADNFIFGGNAAGMA